MKSLRVFTIFLIALMIMTGLSMTRVFAAPPPPFKVICHHNPAQDVTLSFQNQQSYQGHLGTPHNNETYDTDGPCPEASASPSPSASPSASASVSPSPSASASASPSASPSESPSTSPSPSASPSPSESPSPSPSCEPGHNCIHIDCDGGGTCEVTTSPSPSASPSSTPSASPSVSPSSDPSPTPQGSCCSPTTDIPGPGGGSGAAGASGSTGDVLGISTLASTGSFEGQLRSVMMILGTALVALSKGFRNAKKTSKKA